MNSMNGERFFDLAMKITGRQATDAEHAELDALLARQPELKPEFERLQAEVRVARETLPLVNATEATVGELPAYARGRLQTKVRQTLGRPETTDPAPKEKERGAMWVWRWVLGLAAATAVVILMVIPMFNPSPKLVVQVAMFDVLGATRGNGTNDLAALQDVWTNSLPQTFSTASELENWEQGWPQGERGAVKIIYDKAAAEVRVVGKWRGKLFEKTFLVDQDLTTTLTQAKAFIGEITKP